LIGWHTELDTWLPPITGLEYAALATVIDTSGQSQLYVGDYWGRLFNTSPTTSKACRAAASSRACSTRPRAAPSRATTR
jgi:hypothetical protein